MIHRRVQHGFQGQGGQGGDTRRLAAPDHVQNDPRVSWIRIMLVQSPERAGKIDLHVARLRRVRAELHHRAPEVRPRLAVPKARMQHPHRPAVQRLQPVAAEALIAPDGLEQTFRGISHLPFEQESAGFILRPPLSIGVRSRPRHDASIPQKIRDCQLYCKSGARAPTGQTLQDPAEKAALALDGCLAPIGAIENSSVPQARDRVG